MVQKEGHKTTPGNALNSYDSLVEYVSLSADIYMVGVSYVDLCRRSHKEVPAWVGHSSVALGTDFHTEAIFSVMGTSLVLCMVCVCVRGEGVAVCMCVLPYTHQERYTEHLRRYTVMLYYETHPVTVSPIPNASPGTRPSR